jgi:4-aminobutyrate aminotransferase
MIGMEIVEDKAGKKSSPAPRDRIVQACFRRGLLILPCGPHSVRFVPPLVIGKEEADRALEIFEESLRKVEKGRA